MKKPIPSTGVTKTPVPTTNAPADTCGAIISAAQYDHAVAIMFSPVAGASDYCVFGNRTGHPEEYKQLGYYNPAAPNLVMISEITAAFNHTVYDCEFKAYVPSAVLCSQPFSFTTNYIS